MVFFAEGVGSLFFEGTWRMNQYVNRGELDFLLLRPAPPMGQVMASDVGMNGLGNILLGGVPDRRPRSSTCTSTGRRRGSCSRSSSSSPRGDQGGDQHGDLLVGVLDPGRLQPARLLAPSDGRHGALPALDLLRRREGGADGLRSRSRSSASSRPRRSSGTGRRRRSATSRRSSRRTASRWRSDLPARPAPLRVRRQLGGGRQRALRRCAASFGRLSRVKTPLKFSPCGRCSACAVAKSAKTQTWAPATKGRSSATSRTRSIRSAWYSSLHIAGGSAWAPGIASAPNSERRIGLPWRACTASSSAANGAMPPSISPAKTYQPG